MNNQDKFDINGFISYMGQNFECAKNYFVREMLQNLVEYAIDQKGHTLDSIAFFLSDLIPEVEFGEVAMFVDDSLLTSYGKDEAQKARKKLEVNICQ